MFPESFAGFRFDLKIRPSRSNVVLDASKWSISPLLLVIEVLDVRQLIRNHVPQIFWWGQI